MSFDKYCLTRKKYGIILKIRIISRNVKKRVKMTMEKLYSLLGVKTIRLMAIIILLSFLSGSCNDQSKQTAVSPDTSDAISKQKRYLHTTSNDDSDGQELIAIIEDFKRQYHKNYNVDTIFNRGSDSFRLVFDYKCLFDNGLTIPVKYVGIYGLQSFKAHNFIANLLLYKNNSKIVDEKITKSSFVNQTDENLKQYGDLLYPSLKVEDSLIKVHFSISIPLTDVGVGANYIVKLNGQSFIQAD
jgi:hypothetical protein